MPKRYGKRETWRRKCIAWARPPEATRFHRAMYDPHFTRAFYAMCRMRREGDIPGMAWASDAEQCLDRTEIND
jgi:hypothetical protein